VLHCFSQPLSNESSHVVLALSRATMVHLHVPLSPCSERRRRALATVLSMAAAAMTVVGVHAQQVLERRP
jgi:hypothetical protein